MNHERNDEHWQKMLDEGRLPSSDDDSSINPYRLLYEALNEPPQLSIPADFAARAASLAASRTVQSPERSSTRSSWALLLAASVLPLILVTLVLFYFFPHYFHYLLSYRSSIAFTLLMLVAIQAGDYLLIRRKPMYRFWLGFR